MSAVPTSAGTPTAEYRGDPPAVADDVVERIPPIIDVDAHVIEPPDVWTSRLPRALREVGPHVEYLPDGVAKSDQLRYIEAPGDGPTVAWWCYEDFRVTVKRTVAAAGFATDDVQFHGVTYEDMRPGCWQVGPRLADMDENGVEAQLCFPNFPRFCGQQFLWGKDRELARLCVLAYNDWMVEEWCGESGGRLIPLCLVPMWDVDLAVAEIRRNAARGVRAVAFSELPSYLDLPSIYTGYWDPLFAVCAETRTVLAMHIGSGTRGPQTSPDAPGAVNAAIIFGNSVGSLADFFFSGALARHPDLKLLYAEAQIGWIPYAIARADEVWEEHRGWSKSRLHCPEPPSTYYRRQVSSCFFSDRVGIEMLDRVGVENVMFETDYPHGGGTWPWSRQAAAQQFGDLEQWKIDRIARQNAIDLLGL